MVKKRKTRRKSKTKRRKNPKRVKAGKKAARKRKSGSKSRKKNKSSKKTKKRMVGKGSVSKVLNNKILRKVLLAAGVVAVATSVAQIVAPSLVPTLQRPIVRAGLGFVTGDFVGAISNFVIGGGGLGSLTGGNGQSNAVSASTSGFA